MKKRQSKIVFREEFLDFLSLLCIVLSCYCHYTLEGGESHGVNPSSSRSTAQRRSIRHLQGTRSRFIDGDSSLLKARSRRRRSSIQSKAKRQSACWGEDNPGNAANLFGERELQYDTRRNQRRNRRGKAREARKRKQKEIFVVIDTNVVVSSMLKPVSVPGQIVGFAKEGILRPLLNDAIINEYVEVLNRGKFNFVPSQILSTLDLIKENAVFCRKRLFNRMLCR